MHSHLTPHIVKLQSKLQLRASLLFILTLIQCEINNNKIRGLERFYPSKERLKYTNHKHNNKAKEPREYVNKGQKEKEVEQNWAKIEDLLIPKYISLVFGKEHL